MSNSLQYPHLPQEIIDEIIGNLHGDKNSLRACTFVCRNWLYASQTHLFYQLDVFVGRWYFGIPTFLMTIQEYPGIIPFVKSVRFDNGNSYMRTHLPGTSGPYQFVVDARVIGDILFVLYNLHTLIIHELWIQEQVPWEVPIPISQSRPVRRELKELVLEGCKVHFRKSPPRVQRVNPLLDVLNTFQRIDKLSILGPLHLPDDLDHPSAPQGIYPQLHIGSFTMTSGPYLNPRARTTFWSPFLQIVNASSISAFMYACIENEDAKLLTSSLSHLPNLRRFHINVGSIWGFEDIPMRTDSYNQSIWSQLNLSTSCPSLQSLQIDFTLARTGNADTRDLASWETVFNIISSAPSTLSSLSLRGTSLHHVYDDTLLTRVDWDRLRFLLYLFPSLNSVLLEIMRLPWSPIPESGAQIIKQELGWLDERGILEVPFYSPAPSIKRTRRSPVSVPPSPEIPSIRCPVDTTSRPSSHSPMRPIRPGILVRWLSRLKKRRSP